MSFGFSVSDAVLLAQLGWKTAQNSRKACGEYEELTREVHALHVVLRRLENIVRNPNSPIDRPNSTYREELGTIMNGCRKVLDVTNKILEKYNALSEREKTTKKLWQRVRFGNGEMADLTAQRAKLTHYTSLMNLLLSIVSTETVGQVETSMNEAGGDIKEIKVAVNSIVAHLFSKGGHEGSVLTAYADDDRSFWKEFRRELIIDGFPSSVLKKHKATIKAYIMELGDRGLLDDINASAAKDQVQIHEIPPAILEEGSLEQEKRIKRLGRPKKRSMDKRHKAGTSELGMPNTRPPKLLTLFLGSPKGSNFVAPRYIPTSSQLQESNDALFSSGKDPDKRVQRLYNIEALITRQYLDIDTLYKDWWLCWRPVRLDDASMSRISEDIESGFTKLYAIDIEDSDKLRSHKIRIQNLARYTLDMVNHAIELHKIKYHVQDIVVPQCRDWIDNGRNADVYHGLLQDIMDLNGRMESLDVDGSRMAQNYRMEILGQLRSLSSALGKIEAHGAGAWLKGVVKQPDSYHKHINWVHWTMTTNCKKR